MNFFTILSFVPSFYTHKRKKLNILIMMTLYTFIQVQDACCTKLKDEKIINHNNTINKSKMKFLLIQSTIKNGRLCETL